MNDGVNGSTDQRINGSAGQRINGSAEITGRERVMREAVSDILIERSRAAEGLSRALGLSMLAHAGLLAVIVLFPASWSAEIREQGPAMIISIGGTQGPDTPGLTSIAERPVQTVAAPNEKPADAPPAPKAPEMVEAI